jgi:hypothetical protein
MLFGEVFAVNDTKPINTLCGENAELLNVKVGGACGYRRALKNYSGTRTGLSTEWLGD